MIRLVRKQPLFALLALVGFTLSGVLDARALHPCTQHDGLAEALAPEMHHGAHGTATASAEHTGHTSSSQEASSALHAHGALQPSEDGGTRHEGCTCLGHCCAGAATSVPTRPLLALRIAAAATFVPVPPAGTLLSHKTGGLWLLHLPTAPPLSV